MPSVTTVIGSDAEDLVSLLVPKKYYSSLVQELGRLLNAEASDSTVLPAIKVPWPTEGEEAPAGKVDWTDVENCRRLRAHLKNPAALAMLDLTAEKPGERVYLDAVVERCGCTRGQVKAGLGALTKAVRMVFGVKDNWPAPFRWDQEKYLAYYIMTAEVAVAWKASAKPAPERN